MIHHSQSCSIVRSLAICPRSPFTFQSRLNPAVCPIPLHCPLCSSKAPFLLSSTEISWLALEPAPLVPAGGKAMPVCVTVGRLPRSPTCLKKSQRTSSRSLSNTTTPVCPASLTMARILLLRMRSILPQSLASTAPTAPYSRLLRLLES